MTTETDDNRRHRARASLAGIVSHHGPDSEKAKAAREAYAEACESERQKRIARQVEQLQRDIRAELPKLSDEDVLRLAQLAAESVTDAWA